MSDRPIQWLLEHRGKRRPTRFRAVVEALDSRLLMASGVTGLAEAVSGSASSPLLTLQDNIPPVSGLGGFLPSEAPVGTPIPLVRLFGPTADTLSASGYSGTVDWGDGSPVDPALFGNFVLTTPIQLPSNTLLVSGPDHTYKTPGNYNITVSVTGPGDSAPTVYHDSAGIAPAITGRLNPSSDTGYFANDNVTSVNTPNFLGTAAPGATVALSATSNATGQTLVVGTGVADASGVWGITTVPFVDGSYTINAQATDPSGHTAGTLVAGQLNAISSDFLVIDTAGPKITDFRVIAAKKGTFQATFSDPAGLIFATLADPNTYTVNRPSPTPKKGRTFPVAALSVTSPVVRSINDSPPLAFTPVQVIGLVGNGKPLINGNGVYTFTIRSAGIVSLSGVTLDGKYTGKFPTDNGVPGDDFQARVIVRNGKASGPIAITPVKVTTHPVKAKAAVKHQV